MYEPLAFKKYRDITHCLLLSLLVLFNERKKKVRSEKGFYCSDWKRWSYNTSSSWSVFKNRTSDIAIYGIWEVLHSSSMLHLIHQQCLTYGSWKIILIHQKFRLQNTWNVNIFFWRILISSLEVFYFTSYSNTQTSATSHAIRIWMRQAY